MNIESIRFFLVRQIFYDKLDITASNLQGQIKAKKPHNQLHLTYNLFKSVCKGKLFLFGDPL